MRQMFTSPRLTNVEGVAKLLNEAGIPAICFGPGDIALAHSAEEFVPVAEIVTATRVLTSVVSEWMH